MFTLKVFLYFIVQYIIVQHSKLYLENFGTIGFGILKLSVIIGLKKEIYVEFIYLK